MTNRHSITFVYSPPEVTGDSCALCRRAFTGRERLAMIGGVSGLCYHWSCYQTRQCMRSEEME